MDSETKREKEKLPAGLELVYDLERPNIKKPLDAFILAIHWAVVRAGLRMKSNNPDHADDYTERLPSNWQALLLESPEGQLALQYFYPSDVAVKYELTVLAMNSNQVVVVLNRVIVQGSNESTSVNPNPTSDKATTAKGTSTPKNPSCTNAASTFFINEVINTSIFTDNPEDLQWAANVFHHATEVETKLWAELLGPLDVRAIDQPPTLGPYDDKTKPTSKERQSQTNNSPQPRPSRNPLIDDRNYPLPMLPIGGLGGRMGIPIPGGLGRSDLDPLGGIGAGMLADPRGFRQPRGGFNPGNVPGARFDPFGPPNPERPGAGTGHWAVPDPDHEQPPPGFDDMFM